MRGYWLDEALVREGGDAPPLTEHVRADVCIVGAGYTGLWTAIHLKEREPSLDVVVVERDIAGGGASGRNGGFVLSWWAKFSSLKKVCGAEEALRLARASADAVGEIGRFCSTHGIDAHFRPDGWLWTATSPAQIGAWDAALADAERLGARPFVRLSGEEVAARSGSPRHLAGVFEATAATVQPALLARGLRRVALDLGVRIFEHTPMTRLERANPPRVHTPRGSVSAERVVLALNAWAAALPELRRYLVVIASDMIATGQIAPRLSDIGWTGGLAISDSRLLVNYYRTTLDGRIAFGKGGGTLGFGGRAGARFDGASPRCAELERSLHGLYPTLGEARAISSWTGPIDRTMTGIPAFGRLGGRPDIFFGVGYSGNGVGPALLGGRILASLALGIEDEWARCGVVRALAGRFPPEPIRFLGGLVVRVAVARKERAEDAGRRPGAVVAALAGLAPAGLVPIKEEGRAARETAGGSAGEHGAQAPSKAGDERAAS